MEPLRETKMSYQLSWEQELTLYLRKIGLEVSYWPTPLQSYLMHKNWILKILTRWYRVPSLLHSLYLNILDSCWSFGATGGTMTHIWWELPHIQPFWSKGVELIKLITGIEIRNDSTSLLLYIIPIPIRVLKGNLFPFLLIAGKWQSSDSTTTHDHFFNNVWRNQERNRQGWWPSTIRPRGVGYILCITHLHYLYVTFSVKSNSSLYSPLCQQLLISSSWLIVCFCCHLTFFSPFDLAAFYYVIANWAMVNLLYNIVYGIARFLGCIAVCVIVLFCYPCYDNNCIFISLQLFIVNLSMPPCYI